MAAKLGLAIQNLPSAWAFGDLEGASDELADVVRDFDDVLAEWLDQVREEPRFRFPRELAYRGLAEPAIVASCEPGEPDKFCVGFETCWVQRAVVLTMGNHQGLTGDPEWLTVGSVDASDWW